MTYIHQTHGRLRLKSPAFAAGLRTNALCSALAGAEGIQAVRFNKRSNSLIVEYDPALATGDEVLKTVACLRESIGLTDGSAPVGVGSGLYRSTVPTPPRHLGLAVAKILLGSVARTPFQRGLVSLLAVALR